MSAILSKATAHGHTSDELADLDRHDSVRRARVVLPAVVLTTDELAGTDDMGDFFDLVKTEIRGQFREAGWGNTAAGELADLHVSI